MIKKIADLVNDKVLTEISDLADHTDRTGHADPDRAEARRDPAGRAEQALQAHGAPDDVRLQRRRARRRRAADALAARAASRTTSTSSARSSRAARSTSCARPRSARTSSQGYLIALDNLDAVIALIRAAADTDEARTRPDGALRALRDPGARRSSTCASRASPALARKEVEDEYADLQERIGELRALLGDEAKIDALIREELLEIKRDLRHATTTGAPRSSPPRRSSSSRT